MQQISGEIIVVDNASEDKSVEHLRKAFPDVQFIFSPTNIGFARANNLGLAHASGQYVLFLNPDTLVPENTLSHCVQFLHKNISCGAVGVRMINGFGNYLPESKRARPGLLNAFFKLTGVAALFPKSGWLNHYALGHLSIQEQHPVAILAGAFMMVRKTILNQLDGFDAAFFMYGEDVDLSVRVQQLGYSIFYLGDACIIHYKGQSSRNRTQQQNRIFYKAMRLFVQKHYRLGGLLIPFIFLVQWMAAFRKWLSPPRSVMPMLNSVSSAFVLGDLVACEHARLLINNRSKPGIIKGCIGIQEKALSQIGHLSELSLLCQQYDIKQLIICVPDLSLQEATQLMTRLRGLFFRFVFTGSDSLPFNN